MRIHLTPQRHELMPPRNLSRVLCRVDRPLAVHSPPTTPIPSCSPRRSPVAPDHRTRVRLVLYCGGSGEGGCQPSHLRVLIGQLQEHVAVTGLGLTPTPQRLVAQPYQLLDQLRILAQFLTEPLLKGEDGCILRHVGHPRHVVPKRRVKGTKNVMHPSAAVDVAG